MAQEFRLASYFQRGFLVALIGSLVIGFSDIMISILFPPRFHSAIYMFTPMAITFLFFFIFQVAAFSFFALLARPFKLNAERWFVSFASFLGVFFIIGSTADLFAFGLEAERVLKLLLTLLFALLFGGGLFVLLDRQGQKEIPFNQLARSIGFALPFIFAEMMVFTWLVIYSPINVVSAKFIFLTVLLAAAGILTVWVFHRIKSHGVRAIPVILLAIAVAGSYAMDPETALDEWKASKKAAPKDGPKYVLLITVDTLRADALSCYNNSGLSRKGDAAGTDTPNIDAFANESVLFEKSFSSSSWTLPAVASLMTGMPPEVHQASRSHGRITDALPTLAEYMKNWGYFTGAIGINPTLTHQTHMSNGFVDYDFYPKFFTGRSFGSKIQKRLYRNIGDEKLMDVHSENLVIDFNSFISTEKLTDMSIDWIGKNKEKPFMLWVHYFDPHVPYAPPMEWMKGKEPYPSVGYSFNDPDALITGAHVPDEKEKQWIKELYLGEVRYVDHNIGRLLKALTAMGIYDETLIILTSDHGEEFWEHGEYYHGHSLYNELLWVPLIIKRPGLNDHKRVPETVGLQNIMPTILDYCNIGCEKSKLYSQSLVPFLKKAPGKTFEPQPVISSAMRYGEEKEAVTRGDWKYIRSTMSKKEELYDFTTDPLERVSVAQQFPMKLEEAKNHLKIYFEWVKRIVKAFKIKEAGKNAKTKQGQRKEKVNNLKTLGYF